MILIFIKYRSKIINAKTNFGVLKQNIVMFRANFEGESEGERRILQNICNGITFDMKMLLNTITSIFLKYHDLPNKIDLNKKTYCILGIFKQFSSMNTSNLF